jgi:repressor LexA
VLTAKEKQILNFIGEYLRDNNGSAPTLSEIGKGCDITSTGTVHRYVTSLEDKGVLGKARSGWRTRQAPNELPFRGNIVAGKPLEAIEQSESIDLFALVAQPGCFVLKVKGESMKNMGILEGDLVVIKPTQTARNGDIVVALVNKQDASLKEFKRMGRRILLIPHNDKMDPMEYPEDQVEVQGVLSSVIRTY